MLCACGSYFLVERPVLRFRDRRRSASALLETIPEAVALPRSNNGLKVALNLVICTNARE
jgi:hypothetical protein